ncbi:uncharacterized protein LOC132304673 [Cornus florida]|uniref:uncharacterized protein LOC132304673 n=1 Tax=Cornus florida TaxID=4283 RepID=UPI00289F347D|nr:uncharacterized protein LOC132304673 [Cornus florida]
MAAPLSRWDELDRPLQEGILTQKEERKAGIDQRRKTVFKPEPAELGRSNQEELEKVDLTTDDWPRITYVNKGLPAEEKTALIEVLKEFSDVFAWTYDEVPGLNPQIVAHHLNIRPGTRPVKQAQRNFRPELELQIKEEVQRLSQASFIKPIQYPTWLANIVLVKKKNEKIRVCVDFKDLNKACPKDDFPLPIIDSLVDSTSGHEMFSFMDGYSGYNHIKMTPCDAEKIAFRTPLGNFHYTVMPFGLKNAGATYQRAMTAIFHDMLHRNVEDYMDDLVIKSRRKEEHLADLRRVFERCRKYKLKMNPLKCAFRVEAGRFLALAEVTHAFGSLLKGSPEFKWGEEHQQALIRVKNLLSSLITMVAPQQGIPLRLYITSTEHSIRALLAQEKEGRECPIYYISRVIQGAEVRYLLIEHHCLSLAFVVKKFRHYFLAHTIHLITRCDPLRYLFSRLVMSRRVAADFCEFDIQCSVPRAILSQALADLMAQFPSGEYEPVKTDLPHEDLEEACCAAKDAIWTLSFDGSSTAQGGAEYEALVLGLLAAREGKVKRLHVQGDSNLVVKQLDGSYTIKEPSLAAYRTIIQKLSGHFDELCMTHTPRTANRHPDALATLASKVAIVGESVNIRIQKKEASCLHNDEFTNDRKEENWRDAFESHLRDGKGKIPLSELKDYTLYLGTLYYRAPGGILARCVGTEEAACVLHTIHKQTCGNDSLSFIQENTEAGVFLAIHGKRGEHHPEGVPEDREDAAALKRDARRFFISSGELMRRGFDGNAKRCISTSDVQEVLKQTHGDEHQGWRKLYNWIIQIGYYWPTMQKDSRRLGELEGLQEQRDHAKGKLKIYQQRVARAYNATVRPRAFQEGELVLRTATHIMRNQSGPKFTPKWEGPYEIRTASGSGYYEIGEVGSNTLGLFNAKWLKKYYA